MGIDISIGGIIRWRKILKARGYKKKVVGKRTFYIKYPATVIGYRFKEYNRRLSNKQMSSIIKKGVTIVGGATCF